MADESPEILPDIQGLEDKRGVTINRVGITEVSHPLYIESKTGESILVYAKIDLFTSLMHNLKGTNMSRYMEVISRWANRKLSLVTMKELLTEVRDVAKSMDAYAEISFQYFLVKKTPVSQLDTVNAYPVTFIGHVNKKGVYKFFLKVDIPVTSVCPCSKEISKAVGGAHNQRASVLVTLELQKDGVCWLEDLIPSLEKEGSCEIWELLKRPDEKYVTIEGYNNPKFVEDIARDVAKKIQKMDGVRWLKVRVTSFESIHLHNAVAIVERVRKGNKWVRTGKTLRG